MFRVYLSLEILPEERGEDAADEEGKATGIQVKTEEEEAGDRKFGERWHLSLSVYAYGNFIFLTVIFILLIPTLSRMIINRSEF